MTTQTFKMKKDKAFGFPLSELKVKEGFAPLGKTIEVNGKYDTYDNFVEVQAAHAELSPEEQVKARNAKIRAAAKAKAEKQAWADLGIIEPTMQNDVQLQLKAVFDGIMAGGKRTKEEARAIAAQAVGAEWADDDADDE
jgi:hypothetical protein